MRQIDWTTFPIDPNEIDASDLSKLRNVLPDDPTDVTPTAGLVQDLKDIAKVLGSDFALAALNTWLERYEDTAWSDVIDPSTGKPNLELAFLELRYLVRNEAEAEIVRTTPLPHDSNY